jgi:hypothetical protein
MFTLLWCALSRCPIVTLGSTFVLFSTVALSCHTALISPRLYLIPVVVPLDVTHVHTTVLNPVITFCHIDPPSALIPWSATLTPPPHPPHHDLLRHRAWPPRCVPKPWSKLFDTQRDSESRWTVCFKKRTKCMRLYMAVFSTASALNYLECSRLTAFKLEGPWIKNLKKLNKT